MSCSASKLEVEDEENRQQRIGNLLEQLNSSSSKNTSSSPAPPTFDFGERKTYPVDPPSELLGRVQDFLSHLKAENDTLAQRIQDNPSSVDIENIDEQDKGRYIEMNLGLGVFETRPHTDVHSSSHSEDEGLEKVSEDDSLSLSLSSLSSSSTDSTSSAESDSEDVSDSDSSADSSMRIEAISSRPIRPLPRRAVQSGVNVLSDPPSGHETGR